MARMWLIVAACGAEDGDFFVAITADPPSGRIPLEVTLEATGLGESSDVSWTFDDGARASGETVVHTFLSEGVGSATVTWTSGEGTETATVEIEVQQALCPTTGAGEPTGAVTELGFDEISGVAASRMNTGILWFHEDKNNPNHVYATDATGAMRADYDVDGLLDDLEDIAVGQDPATGKHRIYLGDIGDNDYALTPRTEIAVYLLDEPPVTPGQTELHGTLQVAVSILLNYPDGPRNAEALLVDPVTDDLFVVTKESSGSADVFRKAAPHVDGERAVLERVGNVDLANATAGDISPLGNEILLRTYGTQGLLWRRDGAESVADALGRAPCEVELAREPQSESVGFAADSSGIWSISEGTPDVIFTPLTRRP